MEEGTWSQKQIVPNQDFTRIFFPDALNGIIIGPGGFITRTTDGGTTW